MEKSKSCKNKGSEINKRKKINKGSEINE